MKPIVVTFVGGVWDGKALRSDADDKEEEFVAAECYEMSHHGAVGAVCKGLFDVVRAFALAQGWGPLEELEKRAEQHFVVTERRETETETTVTFRCTVPSDDSES